jgi:AcrR family transcriptional regulator
LDAARAILVCEGLPGLSVRRVADKAGCTTMAVYTQFAGKSGIVVALYDEGFERLAQAQAAVPTGLAPPDRICALCHAYRVTAHRFPHHYALMLGRVEGSR